MPMHDEAGLEERSYARLVLFSGGMQALYAARHLVVLPFLTQSLGPELYGAWSKMFAFVNLMVPLLGLGLTQAMERFVPSAPPEIRAARFWTAAGVIGLAGLLLFGAMPAMHPWLAAAFFRNNPGAVTLPIVLGLGVLAITMALAQAGQQFFRLSGCPRRYALLSGVILGVLALWSWSWWRQGAGGFAFPILLWGLATALAALVAMFLISREGVVRGDRAFLRDGIRHGLPLVPAALFAWIMAFADRYMLTWLLADPSESAIGNYAAQYALGGTMLLAFGPLTLFFMPRFVRLWDSGARDKAWRFLTLSVGLSLVAAGVVLAAGGIWGMKAMRLVAGPEFAGSRRVLLPILLGYAFGGVAIFLQAPLQCAGKTRRLLVNAGAAAAANVALNAILIPRTDGAGGICGAALATALSCALLAGLHLAALPRGAENVRSGPSAG